MSHPADAYENVPKACKVQLTGLHSQHGPPWEFHAEQICQMMIMMSFIIMPSAEYGTESYVFFLTSPKINHDDALLRQHMQC